MRRRHLLTGLATGTAGLLAGCTVGYSPESDGGEESPRTVEGDLPLPESAFRRAAPRDAIPAIVDPVFAPDWSDVAIDFGDGQTYRPQLAGDDLVIGVERESVAESAGDGGAAAARAYPLSVLNWHEVVNDDYGGPLLVTYCPLCRSGLVARRRVRGEATVFGVSGVLLSENLVLYDRATESQWSQIRAEGVRGPMTGTPLEVLPSSLTSWGDWRADHPDTEVLVPPPRSGTVVGEVRIDYGFELADQQREAGIYLEERLGNDHDDSRLAKRALVLGVASGEASVAYPLSEVAARGLVEDRVGDLPVVVAGNNGSAVAYDRRIDGETLSFEGVPGEPGIVLAGGSRWAVETGRALDGPYEGRRLVQANRSPPLFFFAWLVFHPETRVWGRERDRG